MFHNVRQIVGLFGTIAYAMVAVLCSAFVVHAAPGEVFADKYAVIVIDANSGKTLFEENASVRRYPASLTKMITLYLLFEAMQSGRICGNTPIPVSAYAASRPPTKMGLRAGQRIAAETAAKALIARSANDVASAIGEYLGGSEKNFARMMTVKARQLGMKGTNFTNASGLPDTKNYSTARDMAILSLALRQHFPRQYRLFNTTSFAFHGRIVGGHNRLVKSMEGVDGIKTGYTRMSGFNLASSRRSGGKSIVAVVMGGRTALSRDTHMANLLGRYMEKASIAKSPAMLVAARPAGLPEGDEVPVPVAKVSVDGTATGVGASTVIDMSDREYDSALLTALASQDFIPSAAVAAADEILVKNPPLSVHKTDMDEKKGWIIQIASLPTQSEANHILDKASHTVRAVVNGAEPYTQFFEKGGARYYRARFSGFSSGKAARNACSELKKMHLKCYTLEE